MQKTVLIPLIAISAFTGCGESTDQQSQRSSDLNTPAQQQAMPQWAGQYHGITPCMGCIARCEDCPGMSVEVKLGANQSFVLSRISLSGHNEVETIQGHFKFINPDQSLIQLDQVSTRNIMLIDLAESQLEIREDQTAQAYIEYVDFTLAKEII